MISLLKGIWIYALIIWAYIVLDTFLFPEYQFLGISKWIPIPQNIVADLAFPVSFLAFVLWDYQRKKI
ncbi:MAG: hypothetical protein JRN52_00810 [Nitrososphaerota archaeon]|nr:hypothetical protein [Nitrososphaerota archaeon]